MDAYKIENLSFKYEDENAFALKDISLTVNRGDFVLLCGKSGCGKSTLLRLLKHSIAPVGTCSGSIRFFEKPIEELSKKETAAWIGFVSQNPDNQIICDDVYGELCFGMSRLGYDTNAMGRRVFEVANYFGISHYLNTDIHALSGGQKQLLTMASVLCTSPHVLLLDEPTSGLDANSADLLITALEKLNRELGITIIVAEQNLNRIYPVCNKVALMENGRLSFMRKKEDIAPLIQNHEHKDAFPVYVRVLSNLEPDRPCPKNMNEAKIRLNAYTGDYSIQTPQKNDFTEPVLTVKNLWVRMTKNGNDILKGANLTLNKGEISCILGANGSGKTTLLKAITGAIRAYEGKVKTKAKICAVSQSVDELFCKETVRENFISLNDRLIDLFELSPFLDKHPFDLSGGELQRAAIVLALSQNPQLLLLDEVTKALGSQFKTVLGNELQRQANENGTSILLASHDIDFCAEYTHSCHLLFNGAVVARGETRELIKYNDYYTTNARIFARDICDDVITEKDVNLLCSQLKTIF